ncbi:uncharacterized protein LOC111349081 [Spodoptera litura]|uniref:Uncharacterized protein LOC111349081 n=1 Tax=Spodoptera litura TaxID=69820 RepID=A0A9J7IK33_SPOLT|nr:uncharacterized protein LOC111349081 [Spodoptera litura]
MSLFWFRFYSTILFFLFTLEGTNCSIPSIFLSQNGPQPVPSLDDIDDDTFNELIRERPDLEHILNIQRKTQLRRHEMPYLMKQNKKNGKYENDNERQIMLVENDDDDITRPLSDFHDGRTTVIIDPSLVPEYPLNPRKRKGSSGIYKKEQRFNNTRRGILWDTPEERAWKNAWWAAHCYNCFIGRGHTPRHKLCHAAFHSNNWKYRTQKRYFRTACYYNWAYRNYGYWKYKAYSWYGEYEYHWSRGLTVHRMGMYTKGCMKRYSDVGEVYTMRACRGYWPMYIGGYLEHRQIRNDLWIGIYPNHTCRMAHHATLIPFNRGISLFGRLRSCSCVGRYCNNAVVNNIYMPLLVIEFLIIYIEVKQ